MKIFFRSIGKPHESYVKEGIEMFTKRISNYFPVQWQIIPSPRNAADLTLQELKKKEGEALLNGLTTSDFIVLLDERGKELSSESFAKFIQQRANNSDKSIVFIIGGAYGISDEVKVRSNYTWSLSKLVFPHQLVRLILAEQFYRACTILKNEKYHHQ